MQRERTQSRFSPGRFNGLSSVPPFHDLRVGFSCRLFAVLVVYLIQHGTSSLRATVTEPVIELVNPLNVRTVLTVENQTAAPASADCVHDAEHIPDRFPLVVIGITLELPSFERDGFYRTPCAPTHQRAHRQAAKRDCATQ